LLIKIIFSEGFIIINLNKIVFNTIV